jgi:hypothetical protein
MRSRSGFGFVYGCLSLILTLMLTGCQSTFWREHVGIQVGYTPPGIPVRISIDARGRVSASISGAVSTPIGTFDLALGADASVLNGKSPATVGQAYQAVRSGLASLRQRAGLKDKRLLIVRVDGKATVFEIEQGKQFTLEVIKGVRTYREVNFNMETDGDVILELESASPVAAKAGTVPLSGGTTVPPRAGGSNKLCPRPEACITAPSAGAVVRGPLRIMGTATRPNFCYYKFEFKLKAATEWAFLFSVQAPVANGVLMMWDTHTVPNGAYELRLVVVDNTGNYWPEFPEISLVVQN